MKRLCLEIGHETFNLTNLFPDPGAVLKDGKKVITTEHREVSLIVTRAIVELKKIYGDRIMLVPRHYSLVKKINWINKKLKASDYLLSFHLNSFILSEATGTEVWYYGGSETSRKKAEELAKIQSETLRLELRGKNGVFPDTSNRYGRLGIIRDTIPWAFLCELGFLSNPDDLKKIRKFGVSAIIDLAKYLLK